MSVRDSPGKFFFSLNMIITPLPRRLRPWFLRKRLTRFLLASWTDHSHKKSVHAKNYEMSKYITIPPRQFFRFPCLPHHETPLRNRTTTSLSASKKSPTYTFFGNQPEENIYIKKDQSKYWLKVREIKTRKNNKLNSGIDITFSKRRENYYIPHPSLEVTYV